MDNQQQNVHLDVPVTDAERATVAGRKAREAQHDAAAISVPVRTSIDHSVPAYDNPPSRFPSIHGAPVRQPPSTTSQRVGNRQYVPIFPIHEEDGDEGISLNVRDSSTARLGSWDDAGGRLLPPSNPVPPLWTPTWLKKWFLGLFALVFALLFVAGVLLWYFDRQNDGFAVNKHMDHVAWTYAPTAVGVLVVAAWRMVDYYTKLTMPFDALQDGPVKPSESLFVDYISAFQLTALLQAIKNSHFAVITTASGFVLLKVLTVFSTGLLVLIPTDVKRDDVSLQAQGFTTDAFDPTVSLDSTTFSSSPVYAYYATMAQGMPLDNGVTFDLAYSTITGVPNVTIPDGATINGIVDAFVPIITCEKLDVNLKTPKVVNDSNADDALATSSDLSIIVKAGDVCKNSSSISLPADNPYVEILPRSQLLGTMQQIYCGSANGNHVGSVAPAGLLFSVTNITYQQTLFENATDLAGGTFTIASNVSRILNNLTNVFCNVSYTMTQLKVANNTRLADSNQAVTFGLQDDPKNSTLPKLSDWNMTNIYMQSSIAAQALFGDTVNDDTISDSSGIFTLMALTQGSQNIAPLLDPARMISAAQQTYKGVSSQYAHEQLRSTASSPLQESSLTVNESRLRVNDVSVFTMCGIFGILVFLSVGLIFIAPRDVIPQDPSSIATMATLLTRSVELNRLLRKEGSPILSNQKTALAGFEFGTAIATMDSGRMIYKIVVSEGIPEEPTTKPTMQMKWWLPITATIPVLAVTLVLPLVLIAVLEVIQRSSDKNEGLFDVADNKWTEVYSHYIPGIVMLIVATLVNMLDFNVAMFGPWSNLSHGNEVSRRTVLCHILGRSAPAAFMQALRSRYLGAILSILASTAAALLTIVVSGLYNVNHFTSTGAEISLKATDSFDLQWSNSFTTDNGAAAIVDLIMHQNYKYPQFTHEGLVFPRLALDGSSAATDLSDTSNGSYSQVLDAIRGNLRCEILDDDSFSVTTEKAGGDSAYLTDQAIVTASASLPDSCRLGGYTGQELTVTFETNFALLPGGAETYAGAQLDLLFGENATLYGNYGESRGQYISDNPAVGCPSLAFTFGRFKLDSTRKDTVTNMVCYQEIQSLRANVTFRINSTVIDTLHLPVIQNGSTTAMENPASKSGAKSFDFRIQNNLAQEMNLFSGGSGAPATDPSYAETVDIYFQAIINGTNKHDPASLVGTDHQKDLLDAINEFYQIYMAQAINTNMRGPLNTTSSRVLRRQDPSTTTTVTITRSRLVQHNPSKMTLQILLGIMTILAGGAMLTTKMRHVLPCNPCSIAGTMSLLAGSDLCHATDDGLCECCGKTRRRSFGLGDRDTRLRPESIHAEPDEGINAEEDEERKQIIPDGAEWMKQGQFEIIFGGRMYSMGWWRERRATGKRRRFGVDVGSRADGLDDQDWDLGARRTQSVSGFGDFMMRGGIGTPSQDVRGQYASVGAGAGAGVGARGRRPSAPELEIGLNNDDEDLRYERFRPVQSSGGGGDPGLGMLARRATLGGEA